MSTSRSSQAALRTLTSVLLSAALVNAALLAACTGPEGPDDVEDPTPEPGPVSINAWNEGPYGQSAFQVVEDWDIETTAGVFDFKESWTGEDSYVFFQRTGATATRQVWEEGDLADFFEYSPTNVHYFFVSARASFAEDIDNLQNRFDAELETMDEDDADWWRGRLHFSAVERNEVNSVIEDIFEDWESSDSFWTGAYGFAIDRFQRLREFGLMRFVTSDGSAPAEMWFAAHLPRYFNYEYARESHLADNPADLEIPIYEDFPSPGGSAWAEVELPAAADLASYDTLEIDLEMGCVDDVDANCFEWDYRAHMQVCAIETGTPNIPESCDPGERDVDNNWVRDPETVACSCTSPYEGDTEAVRTCNPVTDDDGNWIAGQYGDCACGCGPEIARWITSYHRVGRWVTDISPSLSHMLGGGPAKLRFVTSYPYKLNARLLLSDRDKGYQPLAVMPLWGGGNFNSNYNPSHEDVEFQVPEGTVRAEIVAFITGHGFNGDAANCAEFCPHAHNFQVNGGEWHTREFDEARSFLGCIEQIDDGAVPNQYGTWYLGRGGWCPGMDVPPYVADVTADLTAGTNIAHYQASLNGNEPDNHGDIWMSSYLVFYGE